MKNPWRCIRLSFQTLLKKGLNQKSLALTLALGVVSGILPTVWGSTLLCIFLATILGLNQFAIQVANYLVYPLQILLFLPFWKLGQMLFGDNAAAITSHELVMGFRLDFIATLSQLGAANLKAIGAWAFLAPVLSGILYFLFMEILRRIPTHEVEMAETGEISFFKPNRC